DVDLCRCTVYTESMIGIIGAMEDEIIMLRGAMTKTRLESVGCFNFSVGELEGKPVVLLRCGIGKVNAAVGCALLLNRYQTDFVINTGSAGGIDSSLTFGDAIISDGLVYYDVDVTAFNYAPGQVPGLPTIFPIPSSLIAKAEQAVDSLKQEQALPAMFNHIRGLIGSGDTFMHDPERIAAVRALFPDIKAVEMEGAAIAHACYLFRTPALIIRALSDIAGVESPITSSEFLPLAAKRSAEIVRRIVRDY
ncbi:MAG: 5'-methylthioadenosine/S-adenosylhomocysteine nucleosidase, partial [Treponema sp.]|nr:5'-methylthioadenosine/S-adenosylhomocysteine nucleosidase [Treponema sp.]